LDTRQFRSHLLAYHSKPPTNLNTIRAIAIGDQRDEQLEDAGSFRFNQSMANIERGVQVAVCDS
jgi:hypothetical protein